VLEISKAIYSKFNATVGGIHNSIYTSVGGRFYKGFAPSGTSFPYITYDTISTTPDRTFTSFFEHERIQVNLWSNSESSLEVENMYTYLTSLYDWCSLTISGYTHLWMQREMARLQREEDENFSIWHYVVDYIVYVEKN
jgi:hypothetical protein